MSEGMNILAHKYTNLRVWLDNIKDKRDMASTLTVGQIYKMLDFLDGLEKKLDSIIIAAFDEGAQKKPPNGVDG